jgi:uncharacterized NAD-dependent epimerase/dehydratase family protein
MPRPDRFVILAEGCLDPFGAKTATSLLRYRGEDVAAVIDSAHAGRPLRELIGVEAAAPVVGTLDEALERAPTALVIGIAPAGGQLPSGWREIIERALAERLDVISGLHLLLGDDPELAALARRHHSRLIDLRRPPTSEPIARGRARAARAKRVLTVGTDCNVGKMVASLELVRAARQAGLDTRFVATGQTGMLISGGGAAIDRVAGDFMAGVTEQLVLEAGDSDMVVVEGQGCLLHPAFSGVTAALLHGSLPDAMVLCHQPGRTQMRNQSQSIPPLNDWIGRYEEFLRPLHRGRVVGIALNCYGLPDEEARRYCDAAADETGLPATDVIRFGAEPLLRGIQQTGLLAKGGDWAGARSADGE